MLAPDSCKRMISFFSSKLWCLYIMNPRSILSNFWGSLHFDTPSFFVKGRLLSEDGWLNWFCGHAAMRPLVYRDIVKIGKYVFYMFLCFLITLYNWWPHGRMAASEDVRLVHQLYFRVNMFSYIVTAPFQVSFALLGGKQIWGESHFYRKNAYLCTVKLIKR